MRIQSVGIILAACTTATAWAAPSVEVGDRTNGAKLWKANCAACHGEDGSGGRTAISVRASDRLAAKSDDAVFALVNTGAGTRSPTDHAMQGKLGPLDVWDIVSHIRSMHLGVADFFPDASRYLVKAYEIDEHGLKRIANAVGRAPKDKSATVFTFFQFEDEPGRLRKIEQDPIALDELKKKNKTGYLVFLPFETKGWAGEVGIAMDAKGVIKKIATHEDSVRARRLNKSLSRFQGHGRKGQKTPFRVGGGTGIKKLSGDVFAAYLQAMETATMYDRDEFERTWADDE